MGTPLRVLIVEDSEDDARPLLDQLQQAGYDADCARVDTPAAMAAALDRQPWDLILSDWTLSRFSGLEALRLVRQTGQDAPFIIVAGPIGEEAVVAALQAGAQDYVRRENLARLDPVVQRALGEVSERRRRRKAEEALLESEERNRRIVETAYEGIWLLDADARTTYVNQRLADMLGYSIDEVLGHSILDFVAGDEARAEVRGCWQRRRQGVREQHEFRFSRKDGSELWTLISASPVYDERGEFIGTLGMVSDISPLKRVEAELREAKGLYECLVEEALVGVYMFRNEPAPQFIYVNPRFAALFGYPQDELVGKPVLGLVAPTSRALVEGKIRERLAGEMQAVHYQAQGLCKDGRVIDVEVLGARTQHQGQPVILGTLVDITERRRAEATVRKQQAALVELANHPTLTAGDLDAAFRQLAEASARTLGIERVGIWLYDDRGARLRNVELYELSPHRHSAGADLTVADYPAYASALKEDRAIPADDARHDPRTRELAEGYLIPLGITSMLDAPVRLHGKMMGIVCHEHVGPARRWTAEEQSFAGSAADMAALALEATERKRAEAALRESEERLRAIADNTPAIISLKDLQGRYLLVNRQAEKLFGVPRDAIRGKTDHDLFPKELADVCRVIDLRVIETGSPLEAEETLPLDGELRTYLSVKFLLDDGSGRPCAVGGISTDITGRKQAEEQLRKSQRMLAEAEEVAQIGSWEWDLATDALTWSAEHYRILGVSPEEFDATYQSFLENVHPDDRAPLRQALEAALREHQAFSMDFRIVRPDGTVRVLHAEGEVFIDARAEPVRMVGTAQDITQRRQAEEELEAARVRIFEAEVEKKRFTREVLRAITNGKLQLVDADDVPTEGRVVAEFSLAEPESYPLLRRRLKEIAQGAGMPAEHVDNLVLAAGEAVTNTIKHAREGRATISLAADRVIVRIMDAGPGIHPDNLPATVLQAGYSTKVSLGMGFTLILDLGDCVWLATGPEGTVVQVANWIHPARHEGGLLEAVLERF